MPTFRVVSSPTPLTNTANPRVIRAMTLWNGSSNDSPPTDWNQPGFDDSGSPWVDSVRTDGGGGDDIVTTRWSSANALSATEEALFRQHFIIPAGTISSASLTYTANDASEGLWLNGTLITGSGADDYPFSTTVSVSTSLFNDDGSDNLLAMWGRNITGSGAFGAFVSWTLSITNNATPCEQYDETVVGFTGATTNILDTIALPANWAYVQYFWESSQAGGSHPSLTTTLSLVKTSSPFFSTQTTFAHTPPSSLSTGIDFHYVTDVTHILTQVTTSLGGTSTDSVTHYADVYCLPEAVALGTHAMILG